MDLKAAAAEYMNEILEPVRKLMVRWIEMITHIVLFS